MLSALLIIPILGAAIIFFLPREQKDLIKLTALGVAVVELIVSLPLYFAYDMGATGYQFVEFAEWIPGLGINYHVGIDGLSVFLVLLTTFLTAISIWASWTAIEDNINVYYALMLLLETAVIGVFVSLDLILFYLFWEASLIPMALLIGRWGGKERVYAATKFIIYTMAGSALMLVGTVYLYSVYGTSDLPVILYNRSLISADVQVMLFFAFALAFAVKVPLFPLHTWLPSAHVQAPTAGSIMLAGVLLKLGTYGMLRFAVPLFPEGVAYWSPLLIALSVIGIIYGALVAVMQDDIKKLVAYSSVAHMGFVVLGIFGGGQQGMSGAVLQMINHGLSTGMLFFLVGVIYEQRHTRQFSEYGGIWTKVPNFGLFFILAVFASVGLPGLNGFVGEFIILLGTFPHNPISAALATFGIVLAAWYLLIATRKMLFGPFNPANENLVDLNGREIAISVLLIAFCFVIGIFPNLFFEIINSATAELVQLMDVNMMIAGQ